METEIEVDEPYQTLGTFLIELSRFDPLLAHEIDSDVADIIWDPELYTSTRNKIPDTFPDELFAQYDSIKPYIKDVRLVSFEEIFSSGAGEFGVRTANLLVERIQAMPEQSDERRQAVFFFMKKFIIMCSEDTLEEDDIAELSGIIRSLF